MTHATPRPVRIASVSKRLGAVDVLRGLSVDIAAGSITVLLGPSGSGKTTLLRLIAGLERPDAGEIRIGDEVVAGPQRWVPPERRSVGLVFQDWALFPHLSVGANVGFGLPRGERNGPRVHETLEMVGLAGFAEREPHTLSGGQQQRVALARALAPRPDVLLLDEPFSNLDAALRRRVRSEVHALLAGLGVTAVFVTHDQEEAFVLGDRVAVLRDGVLVQVGAPRELYRMPVDRWVAGFVGEANLLAGRADGHAAVTAIGPVPLREPRSGAVDVLIRPEQVAVGAPGAGVVDGDVGATVDLLEFHGHDTVVTLLPDGSAERVRARVAHTDAVRGDRVAVRFAGGAAVAFDRPDAPSVTPATG